MSGREDREPDRGWKAEARLLAMKLRWAEEDAKIAKQDVHFILVGALLIGLAIGLAVSRAF